MHSLRWRAAATGALLLFVIGCGTIYNFRTGWGPKDPCIRNVMGGMREDLQGVFGAYALIAIVDLPLSTIGDLVTLPGQFRL